jgi:hypothetical protein
MITYTVDIADGYYSVHDLNEYLIAVMNSRFHFIRNTSSSGAIVNKYYIEIKENSVAYAIQLDFSEMPTTIVTSGVGDSNPSVGQTGSFPAWANPATTQLNRVPKMIINSTNNFGTLIGFDSGSYPSGNRLTKTAVLSTNVPQMTPVSSVLITSNLCQNSLGDLDSILYSFSGTSLLYGSQIQLRPNFLQYYKIKPSLYNFIEIKFLDQDYRQMELKDPDVLIVLSIRRPQ